MWICKHNETDTCTIKGTHPDVSQDAVSEADEYHVCCMYVACTGR